MKDVNIIDVTGLSKNRSQVIANARKQIAETSASRLSVQRNLSVAE